MRDAIPASARAARGPSLLRIVATLAASALSLAILGPHLSAPADGDAETSAGSGVVRSQSYAGHAGERDTQILISAYPHLAGTRLDDCQSCHRGAGVVIADGEESREREFDHCAFCHLLMPASEIETISGAPQSWAETLNPFGRAYAAAGRSIAGLRALESEDSDGDGHANGAEIATGRYPGDAQSLPGQPTVPVRTLDWAAIAALPYHEQLLLLNSHKQKSDTYAVYGGARTADLLAAAGADLEQATSVSFIAPDGFTLDFDLDVVTHPFPRGIYHAGLDRGPAGFVRYPPAELLLAGLVDKGEIPGASAIFLTYRCNGEVLEPGRLDPATGRLEGEGPFRLIVPQGMTSGPGAPDRGSSVSPSGLDDGWDYDPSKDHNAGFCARAVVAVRLNPLPPGCEEFDWKNGGYALLENRKLIVYGAGIGSE